MSFELNEIEVRILGCLVEKQLTTPDYYPLTINALVNACNQKTNREPVVDYDEKTVEDALETLRDKNLVYVFYGSTSRVPKYKHMLPSVYHLEPPEVAIVSVLMLRGPQTLGELNQRTTRLYDFSGLDEVNQTIEGLIRREEPIVFKLERQPGQKEARYAHLLSGEIDMENFSFPTSSAGGAAKNERIEKLERELEEMRGELDSFRREFEDFKKQFE
ncbi:MAG: YceH family protein [Pyrinomonadaceae bacterium]